MANLRAVFIAFLASATVFQVCFVDASLSQNCYFNWGAKRARFTGLDSAELRLDKSGGSGVRSKASYMYGAITMQIKLMSGNSAGTVTTFYLSSTGNKHDEIDFEFLGNATGQPYTIHTNIFTQGLGKREMQFKPWFNPADGYHNYTIFWNPYAVVWLVDSVPIRVFRNYNKQKINFPDSQPMNLYASLWNADQWATQGGRIKTDWSLAPFVASLRNYKDDACFCSNPSCVGRCSSQNKPANWWTKSTFFALSPAKLSQMKWIQKNFMIYNYCVDAKRAQLPKECSLPQF